MRSQRKYPIHSTPHHTGKRIDAARDCATTAITVSSNRNEQRRFARRFLNQIASYRSWRKGFRSDGGCGVRKTEHYSAGCHCQLQEDLLGLPNLGESTQPEGNPGQLNIRDGETAGVGPIFSEFVSPLKTE